MKHDLFDFNPRLTRFERAWRVALLIALIVVLGLDLFYWRPL